MNKLFYILLFSLCANLSSAQPGLPYWNEIQSFKTTDSLHFPEKNQVLFIGSSSFRLWKDVNADFPGYKILNRAFGGATLLDVIRYRYDVIYPYQPRQIVLYCGENDFAASDTVTSEMVVSRLITLYKLIRDKYPTVPFVFVSIKPSPSRAHLQEKMARANEQIRSFLQVERNAQFADVYSAMLTSEGKIREDIFIEDRLHMNKTGYTIWKKILKPFLKKR